MPPLPDGAKVFVKALRLEQKIGVCVERNGWSHSFVIHVKDGELPQGYEGDPEILAAYREVRAAFDKSQRRESCQACGGKALG